VASTGSYTPDLFSPTRTVPTDPAAASRFIRSFSESAGHADLHLLFYCRASESNGVETQIARFVYLTAGAGESIRHDLSSPLTCALQQIRKQVAAEIHRFQGILRFRKLADGLYYAPIEPDGDILPFLGPRMARRFADQRFCIHDRKRDTLYWHDGSRRPSIEVERAAGSEKSRSVVTEDEEEQHLQTLWQRYFHEIAIRERRNPRLQRMKLPARYWKYLPEMNR
jgi:probable DNA metabolism protein